MWLDQQRPANKDVKLDDGALHGTVIHIKERNVAMLKKDLILRNPLRRLGYQTDDILTAGEFGAVLARAGVGKTALLVQLSLNSLLRGKKVLHISLEDPVNKVSLWYQETFSRISQAYDVLQADQLWESILPYRFIMTFRVEGFSVPTFKERLADLVEQDIFTPQMMIIDGFPFDQAGRKPLAELKSLAKTMDLPIWFTMLIHRHQQPSPEGLPVQLSQAADLFEVAVQLVPQDKYIYLKAIKGSQTPANSPPLQLDPSTMLVQDS